MPVRPVAAIVRAPSPRLAQGELTHLDRSPIDVDRAAAQHAGYVALLERLGLEVLHAPALPDHPDGVFVEDTAVVVDDLAVLARPGAASRRGEVASIAALLAARGYRLAEITAPGTLDGGDVLQVGRTVYVGRTTRTDDGAIAQLRAVLAPLGREVVPVAVRGMLHLKSAATALPDGTIVAVPGTVDEAAFGGREVLHVPERSGADVLLVGETVVIAASAPRTAALLAARGVEVVSIDIAELEKAEAGVTCPSILLT
ncbi:MAG: dimethylarginine dimethylaminohydrolase family protein [Nitriliruptoraceae bacterium]